MRRKNPVKASVRGLRRYERQREAWRVYWGPPSVILRDRKSEGVVLVVLVALVVVLVVVVACLMVGGASEPLISFLRVPVNLL